MPAGHVFSRQSALRGHSPPDTPALRPFKPTLARLIPEWRREGSMVGDPSIVLLGEAILRMLLALGREHGCLLIIEDLHWADPETVGLMDYLSANLQ
jgi:hypothetical protein